MGSLVAQGLRGWSRLLTQGFGAGPFTTPLVQETQTANDDDTEAKGGTL